MALTADRRLPRGPNFLRTLTLLLRAAASRAANRQRQRLAQRRARRGRQGGSWDTAGLVLAVLALVAVQLIVGGTMVTIVQTASDVETRSRPDEPPFHVSPAFLHALHDIEARAGDHRIRAGDLRLARPTVGVEATRIARERGGNAPHIAQTLRDAAISQGAAAFTDAPYTKPAFPHRLANLALTITGALWLLMLIGGGEDATFDGQSRRHPMWEWLFSHPAPPSAIFLAEALAPIAASPLIAAAPLVPAVLYGWLYGVPAGLLALVVVGLPVMAAAACAGKALDFAIMLRCSPRNRGAILAIKSWAGISAMALLFFALNLGADTIVRTLADAIPSWPAWPIPTLDLFLGLRRQGPPSMLGGMLACLALSAAAIAACLGFIVWSARRGLVAPAANHRITHRRPDSGFGGHPILRKELLWLARDRGAIVQIILLPLGFSAFNLLQAGQLAAAVPLTWNAICGGGIVLGTLFLTYLGPRALASDGAALWIALSWPQGLERLLRVKAAIWTALTALVTLSIFAFAAYRSPADAWKITLLAPAFLAFAWSIALKATTLATTVTEAGEPEPVPLGRRWATQLGSLSFAIGVATAQWPLAAMGLVYSTLAAAALWESFRARLPFLLDPWSERLPPAPTLTHALVAIGLLTDVALTVAAVIGIAAGPAAHVLAYAATSALVATGTAAFLANRGVRLAAILTWPRKARVLWPRLRAAPAGLALGLTLGAAAMLYGAILPHTPAPPPSVLTAYAVIAVGIAPFCEEFLFRALLYRALDRAWGGWRAIVGSAALFAVYHPLPAWPPVFALGLLNAWLFRRTGRLETPVAAHIAYNAAVTIPLLLT